MNFKLTASIWTVWTFVHGRYLFVTTTSDVGGVGIQVLRPVQRGQVFGVHEVSGKSGPYGVNAERRRVTEVFEQIKRVLIPDRNSNGRCGDPRTFERLRAEFTVRGECRTEYGRVTLAERYLVMERR